MAEISIDDLPDATMGRFADRDAAQAALDAVLAAARHYCGWHVSPVKDGDILVLDGPGGRVLDLPTRKLNALTSVAESDAALDVSKLDWSHKGLIRKRSGARWPCRYRSVTVTINHGFTEAEAADWRNAIINAVDTMARSFGGGGAAAGSLVRKRVDDVEYQWSDLADAANRAVYSEAETFDHYRIDQVLFA